MSPSEGEGWLVLRPIVPSDRIKCGIPDWAGELRESGMIGDSPGNRAIHVLASISMNLSSRRSVFLREMNDPQDQGL